MACLESVMALEKIIKRKASDKIYYDLYLSNHKNFDRTDLIDWLCLLDFIINSRKTSKKSFRLKSHLSKRLMYNISLLYNKIKYDFFCNKKLWWHKITDQIYLGALPLTKHIGIFKKIGITTVLSLVEDFERENSLVATPAKKEDWQKNHIDNIHFSHPDFIPVSLKILYQSACVLNTKINNNEIVYVHCKAGRGRSASAILTYLITFKGQEFQKAFNFLKSRRSHIEVSNKRFKMEILKALYDLFKNKNKEKESLKYLSDLLS